MRSPRKPTASERTPVRTTKIRREPAIYSAVRAIPWGRVATYGEVAKLARLEAEGVEFDAGGFIPLRRFGVLAR